MSRRLHIIVNCTDKKRRVSPREMQLRSITKVGAQRVNRWKDRLRAKSSEMLPASMMYLGAHWTTSLSLPEVAKISGYQAQLWVASAGYGLIPVGVNIKSYSATFSAGHEDSIIKNGSKAELDKGRTSWWRQLSRWRGPENGYPRTIEELVANDHNSRIMVVASAPYLSAMSKDIRSAKAQMSHGDRLILVSAGVDNLGELNSNLLPVNARLQYAVGGSRISLNANIARKVLEESKRWALDANVLNRRYQNLSARLPEIKRYARTPMTDSEVEKYIRSVLRCNEGESATRALRKLRDSGRACEQKRFGQLFKQVKKASYA